MKTKRLSVHFPVLLLICVFLFAYMISPAFAHGSSTLYNGCRGDDVRELQQALIDLGYLSGTADGIFGNNTENAVRKFQKKNKLTVDGLAGPATRSLILSKSSGSIDSSNSVSAVTVVSSSGQSSDQTSQGNSSSVEKTDTSSGSLFSGNYATIKLGSRGDRVKALQKGLISLGFLNGKADGVFGNKTLAAVKAFQSSNQLTVDGIAGRRTLSCLENAVKSGSNSSSRESTAAASPSSVSQESETTANTVSEDINEKISGPSSSSVQLLHWFNDIKPTLSNGQNLLVYDPSTGLSWTLRILSRGRQCDAEPLTAKDTRTMVKAFGGVNTWNQKAVYVQLPNGTWILGSTHDMPHQSGSIKNNDFNGHLCVHFLRDMDEAKQNDPNYGVSNQETIRAWWKKLTGQEITN